MRRLRGALLHTRRRNVRECDGVDDRVMGFLASVSIEATPPSAYIGTDMAYAGQYRTIVPPPFHTQSGVRQYIWRLAHESLGTGMEQSRGRLRRSPNERSVSPSSNVSLNSQRQEVPLFDAASGHGTRRQSRLHAGESQSATTAAPLTKRIPGLQVPSTASIRPPDLDNQPVRTVLTRRTIHGPLIRA